MSQYTCPYCGSENTLSFSEIYESGHYTGTSNFSVSREVPTTTTKVDSYGNTSSSTSYHTEYQSYSTPVTVYNDQARRFAPPAEPTKKTYSTGCLEIIFYMVVACYSFIVIFHILAVIVSFLLASDTSLWLQQQYHNILIKIRDIGILCLIFIPIGMLFSRHRKNVEKKYDEEYQIIYAQWAEQYAYWKKHFYCKRCQNTFLVDRS